MASQSKIRAGMSLEEFLAWSRIDEKPYLEYVDGRIEVKVSPQKKHGLLENRMTRALDVFAEPDRTGVAFPELRCTFAGRSILPDVTFLLMDHIPCDDQGEPFDETNIPPDIHIEIISPNQSVKKSHDKLVFSTSNGCLLGWLLHPYRRTIDVYRPGQPSERLAADGFLDGAPVLVGFRMAVAEVFGLLKIKRPANPGPGAEQP